MPGGATTARPSRCGALSSSSSALARVGDEALQHRQVGLEREDLEDRHDGAGRDQIGTHAGALAQHAVGLAALDRQHRSLMPG